MYSNKIVIFSLLVVIGVIEGSVLGQAFAPVVTRGAVPISYAHAIPYNIPPFASSINIFNRALRLPFTAAAIPAGVIRIPTPAVFPAPAVFPTPAFTPALAPIAPAPALLPAPAVGPAFTPFGPVSAVLPPVASPILPAGFTAPAFLRPHTPAVIPAAASFLPAAPTAPLVSPFLPAPFVR